MKKILLSLSIIGAVAAVVVGATTAYFSDTETSRGNTIAAGAVDLWIDNDSYYNNKPNPGNSWRLDYDIENSDENGGPRQFFAFSDLKPGDSGEDTISFHVNNNQSWLCADVTLTRNDDMSSTEPELDEPGEVAEDSSDPWDGELASHIKWYWWADDGDNVYEDDERILPFSGQTFPSANQVFNIPLADASFNIWGNGPLSGESTYFLGKAWCFGDSQFTPYPAVEANGARINTNPVERPVRCNGASESNITQTDNVMMDIAFRAVQSRNNPDFRCQQTTTGGEQPQ